MAAEKTEVMSDPVSHLFGDFHDVEILAGAGCGGVDVLVDWSRRGQSRPKNGIAGGIRREDRGATQAIRSVRLARPAELDSSQNRRDVDELKDRGWIERIGAGPVLAQ